MKDRAGPDGIEGPGRRRAVAREQQTGSPVTVIAMVRRGMGLWDQPRRFGDMSALLANDQGPVPIDEVQKHRREVGHLRVEPG